MYGNSKDVFLFPFSIVNLSRRLKWAIVIMCCLSSVRRPTSVVRLSSTFHILHFETAKLNSTKLNRKQDLNVFYQFCVYSVDKKNKMVASASDCLRHFWLLLWNFWTEFNSSTKLDTKVDLDVLYQFCINRVDRLKHCRVLFLNRWTEFNKTWQEARSQWPLPRLYFFRADRKNKIAVQASGWLNYLWLLLGTSQQNSTQHDRKQDLNVLYRVWGLFIEKQRWPPSLWLA